MRQIGKIESQNQAERFAAYLIASGTNCTLDSAGESAVVWVHDEDRVADAREEFSRFLSEPDHERYRNSLKRAVQVVQQRGQRAESVRRQTIDLRDRWKQPEIMDGPITVGLIAAMAIVGFQTGLEPQNHLVFLRRMVFDGEGIQAGELWRLVTPIFLHSGVMHFFFNLLWLRDLGLNVEYRIGSLKYLAMVLVIAVLSNSGEYFLAGPFLGGMSGVNYGLFGYVWIRSKLEPESGFWISRANVVIMLGWLVLCMVIDNIHAANWAHAVGLAVGCGMAYGGVAWRSLTRRG